VHSEADSAPPLPVASGGNLLNLFVMLHLSVRAAHYVFANFVVDLFGKYPLS
jgi:hypothetical protein